MKLDFSVAVHSLFYLEENSPRKIASRELAASLDLNAVVIRNILSVLHKKGYIEGTVGKNGADINWDAFLKVVWSLGEKFLTE